MSLMRELCIISKAGGVILLAKSLSAQVILFKWKLLSVDLFTFYKCLNCWLLLISPEPVDLQSDFLLIFSRVPKSSSGAEQ